MSPHFKSYGGSLIFLIWKSLILPAFLVSAILQKTAEKQVIFLSRESSRQRAEEFRELLHKRNDDVIVIEPELPNILDVKDREEKVGAYCRVSTNQEDQVDSLETQKAHYEDMINNNPHWTMVGIYPDPGISATSTKKRKKFNELIEDCIAGKVTLIVTKSVFRFARNTVDCIATCRMLRNLNPPVGVYFETENIFTLTMDSEIYLNMYSMMAQAESETKSKSIQWGIRSRFAKGIPRICDLYGYIRNERKLTPNPETRRTVVMMYKMRANGCSIQRIIDRLHELHIPSPTGKENWSYSTVYYILTNERYVGDVRMQKTVVVDIFSHKSVKNNSVRSYFKKSYHEGIVDRVLWLAVQETFKNEPFDFNNAIQTNETPIVHNDQKYYPVILKGVQVHVR